MTGTSSDLQQAYGQGQGRGPPPTWQGQCAQRGRVAKGGQGREGGAERGLQVPGQPIRHRALRARTSRAPACGAVGAGPGPARWQLPCDWPRTPQRQTRMDPGHRPSPDLALWGRAGRGPTLCPPGRLFPSPGRSPVRGAGEAQSVEAPGPPGGGRQRRCHWSRDSGTVCAGGRP